MYKYKASVAIILITLIKKLKGYYIIEDINKLYIKGRGTWPFSTCVFWYQQLACTFWHFNGFFHFVVLHQNHMTKGPDCGIC